MATTRPWLAQGLQVLVVGLVVVDSMAVTLLLPRVAADFHSRRDAAIWVVNLYQMVVLGLLLPRARVVQGIGAAGVMAVSTALAARVAVRIAAGRPGQADGLSWWWLGGSPCRHRS